MCKELSPWEKAVDFHGHACPGLALGYKVAEVAVQLLGNIRDVDEEIVAIVENDSCAIDAVQSVLGCTAGKGNLIFRNNGKHVYTIGSRKTNKAFRVALIFGKMDDLVGTKEEKVKLILSSKSTDLFQVKEVELPLPQKAIIYKTVQCTSCGEGVMELKAHLQDSQIVCPECFENFTRGW